MLDIEEEEEISIKEDLEIIILILEITEDLTNLEEDLALEAEEVEAEEHSDQEEEDFKLGLPHFF